MIVGGTKKVDVYFEADFHVKKEIM